MHGADAVTWSTEEADEASNWVSTKGYEKAGAQLWMRQSWQAAENLGRGQSIEAAVEHWYETVDKCDTIAGCKQGAFAYIVWSSATSIGCTVGSDVNGAVYLCRYRSTE